MKKLLLFFFVLQLLFGCTGTKQITAIPETPESPSFQDSVYHILKSDSIFYNSLTGLVIENMEGTDTILRFRGHHYFTPASNTKLFTFFTSLKVLDFRINTLKFYETNDSLIIWGTGDPSFLNDQYQQNDFISPILKNTDKTIVLSLDNFRDQKFGPGWSWDDFYFAWQCDKSSLPIYGNVVHLKKEMPDQDIQFTPDFFKPHFQPTFSEMEYTVMRDENANIFQYNYNRFDSIKFSRYYPFRTDLETIRKLLSEHTGKEIHIESIPIENYKTESLPGMIADSLYQVMLQASDNFIAEQLLLNCGSELFDTLNTRYVINYVKENWLSDLPHEFQWVDGSGLSRYNMTTPDNMVQLLRKISQLVPQERLLELLPAGGESGTIRNFYKAEEPFIFAKTGTLSNNHSLSGYLKGDSGQIYIFSFMNSNYIRSSREMKSGMDKVLRILKRNL